MINPEEFLHLMPAAIAWAESRQTEILKLGRPLSEFQLELASDVGVANPEKIRILEVARIPEPADTTLRAAGGKLGLFDWSPAGRAMGYGVEIRCVLTAEYLPDRGISPALYRHEFRHVYQCEQCGSIAKFLPQYLHSIVEYGYADSPFEIDARLHETESAIKR